MIDPADFTSLAELTRWQQDLDRRGLRATGSPEHEDYVDDLVRRLAELGVPEVRTEALAMRRWTPSRWHLAVDDSPVAVTSFVAYSGSTTPDGVTGPLSTEPAPGAIGIVEVPAVAFPAATFDALDWDAADQPLQHAGYGSDAPYERVWLSQDLMRQELARFAAAGAAGLVIIVDLPAEHATGGYLLYDGVHRGLPALFVSREEAGRLREATTRGAQARLVLEAVVEQVQTRNVLGLIPGASDELVVLQSHTDGTNGLEDNGPEAILAMATYLAALPRTELPRSVLVLLTTGHFAIEEAWGVTDFLARHAGDLVPRIAAVLSLEHLGALPSRIDRERETDLLEFEFGCFFASPHRALIGSVRAALIRAAVTEARVLRPFVPHVTDHSPDGTTWPGDGGPFWHAAGLPTANFITGSDYLLNVEPVMGFIDVAALRRQAIAFTEATLELCAVPWEELHARIDDDAVAGQR
ncbi:hypothetical protein [Streptosporangium roseum]|uniref:hypothetical protein n=1 Tax=Streptosporangium roseum TaxID=2001 RepID=UPI003318F426